MKKVGLFICGLLIVANMAAQKQLPMREQNLTIDQKVELQIGQIEQYVELQIADKMRLSEYFKRALTEKVALSDTLTSGQRREAIRQHNAKKNEAIRRILGDKKYEQYCEARRKNQPIIRKADDAEEKPVITKKVEKQE